MTTKKPTAKASTKKDKSAPVSYVNIHTGIVDLLNAARQAAARSVNAIMTASYWEIGRRIIEAEQKGKRRAEYGDQLIAKLATDLTAKFGRGFSMRNLEQMRLFYSYWPIPQTLSAESETALAVATQRLTLSDIANRFPLPWSAYVRLMSVKSEYARQFYETEALRGGWSVRQLDRQINSQFYERTAMSRNKVAMLTKDTIAKPEDSVTPEQAIKDPYVLEFLDFKDEYSESKLEDALIHRLEDFLLELGDDFTFVGRQKRLRLDDSWFRVDLVFFHRRLRCLVIIDLKVGKFTYADAGQMHMYLNYAKAHWMREGENPPVGLILCSQKGTAEAHYALEGLPNKVLAAQYKTLLPDEKVIANQMAATLRGLEERQLTHTIKRKKDST